MDNGLRVGIHQPNLMPWLGYFHKIFISDVFIILDDVQFQKKGASYTNRVSINIGGADKYLTIPVKRPSGFALINATEFAKSNFRNKVSGSLQASYAKAPYFKVHKEFIFDLVNAPADNLADYNSHFIEKIAAILGFETVIKRSSSMPVDTVSTERLIDLIKAVNGHTYISGKGGDNYQDHQAFANASILLEYTNYPKYEYPQLNTDTFIPGLSIVDAIFSIGIEELTSNLFVKQ